MNTDLNIPAEQNADASRTVGHTLHDFEQQCLRVLRCTAKALANSPGGLRFKAGTRPWLEALTPQQADYCFSTQQGA
jgi:hypothetical protein